MPSVPAPSHGLTLNFSGSFTSFESEFKTWLLPSEKIDENSFVFAAANISTAQSKFLLQIHQKDKNSSASPPQCLPHCFAVPPPPIWCTPSAVLCMLDLLPAISLDSSQLPGDQDDDDDLCWVAAHDELSQDEGRTLPERDSEIGAGGGSDRTAVEIRILGGALLKRWLIGVKVLMVWLSLDCQTVIVVVVTMVV